MTRHTLSLGCAFVAALAVSVSAHPAKTARDTRIAWSETAPRESIQSARVHALVGASFHAVSAGF